MDLGKYIPSVNFGNVRDYANLTSAGITIAILGGFIGAVGAGQMNSLTSRCDYIYAQVESERNTRGGFSEETISGARDCNRLRREFSKYKITQDAGLGVFLMGFLLTGYSVFGRKEED